MDKDVCMSLQLMVNKFGICASSPNDGADAVLLNIAIRPFLPSACNNDKRNLFQSKSRSSGWHAILCTVPEQMIEEPSLRAVSIDESFRKLHLLGECVISTNHNTEWDLKQ